MTDSSTRKQINQLVRAAQRAGDVYKARELLKKALELDPSSEKANLWMATVSDDVEQREYYIQRVLEINPKNRIAPYLRRVATPEQRMQSQAGQNRSRRRSNPHRFSRMLMIFGAISLLLMSFVIWNRINQYKEDSYLSENGLRAMAAITDRTVHDDEEYEIYRLWFRFEAKKDGETIIVEDIYNEVPEIVYDAVHVGDEFEVLYLEEEPERAKLPFVLNESVLRSAFIREIISSTAVALIPLVVGGIAWFFENSRERKNSKEK